MALPKAGTAVLASLERLPNPLALLKAFQTNALRLFGFFAPRNGTAVLASLERLPNPLALPKAFQNQTSFAFGFFNAPQLTKASFRRCVALKKPLICMRGLVARTGIEPVTPP